MPVISIEKQKADVLRVISDWGETLQFRRARGEEARTIVGYVERVDSAALEQSPSNGGPLFKVMVVNNAAPTALPAVATIKGGAALAEYANAAVENTSVVDTLHGIGINEIVIGASVIEIAHRPGQTPQPRTVVKVDDSDEAALFLECR